MVHLLEIEGDGLVSLLQVALVGVEHYCLLCVVCPHQLHCQPKNWGQIGSKIQVGGVVEVAQQQQQHQQQTHGNLGVQPVDGRLEV